MKIVKVGFGNRKEAFLEERFSDGVNIIYSDENNKGKTLLIQSILYAMGNEPIFPSGFPIDEYYFYTEAIINEKTYKFLRNKKTIITMCDDGLFRVCNSISEFKGFVNENIFKLPIVMKKSDKKMVDLMLFYQMFFIGQDKRNSSNIFNNGYYNKNDFFSMLCSMKGYQLFDIDVSDEKIKNDIIMKNAKIKELKKTNKFIQEHPILSDYIYKSIDKENFEIEKEKMSEIISKISDCKKQRQSSYIRKDKLENLKSELRSINHSISKGTVSCLNCGSKNIAYSNGDIFFDVSNTLVRNKILESINNQIIVEQGIEDEMSNQINIFQEQLQKETINIPLDLRTVLLYSEDINSKKQCDDIIKKLSDEIDELKGMLEYANDEREKSRALCNEMKKAILSIMNEKLVEIDEYAKITFTDLFTKNSETYSGSEEQEFYYCKILALDEYFRHDFPLIIDSFRDGEISSVKEEKMLKNYVKRYKQVILTATLKTEEYSFLKYSEMKNINAIDYSMNEDNKILQKSHCIEFNKILDIFNVV